MLVRPGAEFLKTPIFAALARGFSSGSPETISGASGTAAASEESPEPSKPQPNPQTARAYSRLQKQGDSCLPRVRDPGRARGCHSSWEVDTCHADKAFSSASHPQLCFCSKAWLRAAGLYLHIAICLEFASLGSGVYLPFGESWNRPQLALRYHFECTEYPGCMPHMGLGADGKWEAFCMLEMFCTLKKAEEIFFL